LIDTIRCEIPISEYNVSQIETVFTTTKHHANTGEIHKTYTNGYIKHNNNDNAIRFFITNNILTLEFSLTKFKYGTSFYNLIDYKSTFCSAIDFVFGFLQIKKPEYKSIKIVRMDVSWNFIVDSVSSYLSYARTLEFPRRTKKIYPNGVYWSTRDESVMFYNKMKEIRMNDKDTYYRFLNYDDKVLRFEITMRSRQLKTLFKRKRSIVWGDIETLDLIDILNDKLIQLRLISSINQTIQDTYMYISQAFTAKQATTLLKFLTLWRTDEKMCKELYQRNFYTYRKKLGRVNITNTSIMPVDINLSVPLSPCVNRVDLFPVPGISPSMEDTSPLYGASAFPQSQGTTNYNNVIAGGLSNAS